jgi:hypothetical protein
MKALLKSDAVRTESSLYVAEHVSIGSLTGDLWAG